MAAAAAVAVAAASNGTPADARIAGFANRIYAIVRNVVMPPRTSRGNVECTRPGMSNCTTGSLSEPPRDFQWRQEASPTLRVRECRRFHVTVLVGVEADDQR